MSMATLEREHDEEIRAESALDREKAELHAEDVHAAAAVAAIMVGIFVCAFVMYSVIAFLAAGGSP